jgi:UDP-N-acetylglucosamine 4,6-dehydratase
LTVKINGSEKLKISKLLKNKTVLITGGAGSIGSALAKKILEYPISSLRILDIDEHALFKLGRKIKNKKIRLLLGSILNQERLEMACSEVDIIFHTAAIKNIEISEYNPIETIETNINGTVNLIKVAMKVKPKIVINVSTDKAAESSTLYGTTKNLGEKLTSWAGNHLPNSKFASVRFGNVIETRGNVFEVWDEEMKKDKPLSLTHPDMKRYFFSVEEAVNFILKSFPIADKGEIFVPKKKSYHIKELADKVSPKHKIIGLRPGEKMTEILLTQDEKNNSSERKEMWIIKKKKI